MTKPNPNNESVKLAGSAKNLEAPIRELERLGRNLEIGAESAGGAAGFIGAKLRRSLFAKGKRSKAVAKPNSTQRMVDAAVSTAASIGIGALASRGIKNWEKNVTSLRDDLVGLGAVDFPTDAEVDRVRKKAADLRSKLDELSAYDWNAEAPNNGKVHWGPKDANGDTPRLFMIKKERPAGANIRDQLEPELEVIDALMDKVLKGAIDPSMDYGGGGGVSASKTRRDRRVREIEEIMGDDIDGYFDDPKMVKEYERLLKARQAADPDSQKRRISPSARGVTFSR